MTEHTQHTAQYEHPEDLLLYKTCPLQITSTFFCTKFSHSVDGGSTFS